MAPVPRAITLPRSVRRMRAKLVRVTIGESYQLWGLKFSNTLKPNRSPKSGLKKRKVPSYM